MDIKACSFIRAGFFYLYQKERCATSSFINYASYQIPIIQNILKTIHIHLFHLTTPPLSKSLDDDYIQYTQRRISTI